MSLDKIDKRILKIMQKDGSINNAELAEKINLSKTACWNRTKRLITEGYIKSIKAVLDHEKLGLPVLVIVAATLDRSTPESFAEFEKAVNKIPVILECLLLAGEYDYWMKIRVKDIRSFNKLYSDVLLHLPGVKQLCTFFALNEIKTDAEIMIE